MACTGQAGAVRSKECKMQQIRSFLSSAWTSFRGQPHRTQAIIASIAGVVLIACCAISAAIGNAGSTASTTTTNTHTSAVTRATATAVVTHATATAKPQPTATHIPTTPTVVPLGPPFVGGPYRNFTHAYGQPINSNNWFYTDSSQQIIVAVTVPSATPSAIVSQVAVLQTPSGWTNAEVLSECEVFLPPGATLFNHADPYYDFHSFLGEIVLEFNGGDGGCSLNIAASA
jgi:hypothetical protein